MSPGTTDLTKTQKCEQHRRDRAASTFAQAAFLKHHVANEIASRIKPQGPFPLALDLGCHDGSAGTILRRDGGIATLISCDPSLGMARAAPRPRLVAQVESLPFVDASFDLVASLLYLHRIAITPELATSLFRLLKPGGVFVAAIFGAGSLDELRAALLHGEATTRHAAAQRIMPLPTLHQHGDWLRAAGFDDVVGDRETITIYYRRLASLINDLRAMAETAINHTLPALHRSSLRQAEEYYQHHHATDDGRLRTTVLIHYLIAHRPPSC